MNLDTVLIVDDVEMNRLILQNILEDNFNVIHAENGAQALDVLFSDGENPSIVLLDIIMPEINGFEVLERMKANEKTAQIPVLFITAADTENYESKGLSMGAVDYIFKPFRPEVVKTRVINHLKLHKYSENLERMVKEKVDELVQTKDKLLEIMANIVEYRNLESGEHVKRTQEFTRIFVDYLIENPHPDYMINQEDYNIILRAVPLHDLGKIGIPDVVLLKPGRLTPEEFEIIKTHSTIGSEIIENVLYLNDERYFKYCYDICRYHHEKWDGNGYPDGLKNTEIPLLARVVSIVDVYDALVSQRVYKPPLSHEEAIRIITEGAGTQFDPYLIEVLIQIEHKFLEVQ